MGSVEFGFSTCNVNRRPKIFDNPAAGRPNDSAKPLIYKIFVFDNPAKGRPHDAAKPLINKIFDNPAYNGTYNIQAISMINRVS